MENIDTLLEQLDALRASLLNDPTNTQLQQQLATLMHNIQHSTTMQQPMLYAPSVEPKKQQASSVMMSMAPSPPDSANTSAGGGGDSGAEYFDATDDTQSFYENITAAAVAAAASSSSVPAEELSSISCQRSQSASRLEALLPVSADTHPQQQVVVESLPVSRTTTTTVSPSMVQQQQHRQQQRLPPPPLERIPSPLTLRSTGVTNTTTLPPPLTPTPAAELHHTLPQSAPPVITTPTPSPTPSAGPASSGVQLRNSSSASKSSEKRRYSQHARTIAGINLVSPFCDLSLLETHPNHIGLFLYYATANDFGNSLLFYLLAAVYRQQTLHTKSDTLMRRWAYELYSTFLLSGAPLELKCFTSDSRRSTLLAHMDEVLAVSADDNATNNSAVDSAMMSLNNSSNPNSPTASTSRLRGAADDAGQLRDVFGEARFCAAEHVKTGLAEFNRAQQQQGDFLHVQCRALAQHVRLADEHVLDHILSPEHIITGAAAVPVTAGIGAAGGAAARASGIFERLLVVQLDNLTFKQQPPPADASNSNSEQQQRKALGSCYSTLAKFMLERKSLPSLIQKDSNLNLLEQWPPMFTKEKSKLMNKIMTSMNTKPKPAAAINGHQFHAESLHSVAFCDICAQLLWGVAPQGYQCQLCQMTLHKTCCAQQSAIVDKCRGGAGGAAAAAADASSSATSRKRPRAPLEQQMSSRVPPTPPIGRAATLDSRVSTTTPMTASVMQLGDPRARAITFGATTSDGGGSFDSAVVGVDATSSPLQRPKTDSISTTKSAVSVVVVDQHSFLEMHASDLELEAEPPAWQQRLANPAILERLVPRERKRQDIINELVHTERTHVRNLKVLYQNFYRPMLLQRLLPPHILDLIFANLEEIIELHSALAAALKARQRQSAMVGSISDVLLSKLDGEEGQRIRIAAGTYCQNQSIGLDILKKRQKRDERLNKFLTEAESNSICRRLQIRDMIPGEMQRLTRYPLLLEQLIKHTDSTALAATGSDDALEITGLQRALRCSQDLVAYVNHAAEEASNRHRLSELQRHMVTAPFDSINLPTTRHFHSLNLAEHRLRYENDLLWHVPSATNNSKNNTSSDQSSLMQQYNRKYKSVPVRALLLDDILVLLSIDDHHHYQQQNSLAQNSSSSSQSQHSNGGGGGSASGVGGANNNKRLVLRYPNAPARFNANQSALLDVDKILSPVVRLDLVRIITPSAAATAAAAAANAAGAYGAGGLEKRFHFLYKVLSPDGNLKNSKVQFYEFEAPSAALRKCWLEQLQLAVANYTNANQYHVDNIGAHMPVRARFSVTRPVAERKRSRHELVAITELLSPNGTGAPLRQSSGSVPPPINKIDASPNEQQQQQQLVVPTAQDKRHTPTPPLTENVASLLKPDEPPGTRTTNTTNTNTTTSDDLDDDMPASPSSSAQSHTASRSKVAAAGASAAGGAAYDALADEDVEQLLDSSNVLISPQLVSIVMPPTCECAEHVLVPDPAATNALVAKPPVVLPDPTTSAPQRPTRLAVLQHLDALNRASTRRLRCAIEQSERLKHLIVTTTTTGASVCIVNSPPIMVFDDHRRRRRSSSLAPGSSDAARRASSAPPEEWGPLMMLAVPPPPAVPLHRQSLVPTSPAPAFDPLLSCVAPPPSAAAFTEQLLDITHTLNEQLKALMTLSDERDAQVQQLRQQCNSMRGCASFPQVQQELGANAYDAAQYRQEVTAVDRAKEYVTMTSNTGSSFTASLSPSAVRRRLSL